MVATPSIGWAARRIADPTTKCQIQRLKQAAKYAKCLLNAEAQAVRSANTARFSDCEQKFSQTWGEADAAGGCPPDSDLSYVRNEMESAVFSVAVSIEAGFVGAGTFVDNADGTITDPTTGLMWEKKDESGGLHDRDRQFERIVSWVSVDDWIDEVNGEDGIGFAGYGDWRLPTIAELQTLIRHDAAHPATANEFDDSCFDGCTVLTCSCTSSGDHYTSTGYAFFDPDYSWVINFFDGQSSADANWTMNFVRLVREAN